MLRTLRSSVAILAATAALASPLAAQTVPGTPAAPAAPSASAPAPAAPVTAPVAALPSALTELGISDARLHEGRRGGAIEAGDLERDRAERALKRIEYALADRRPPAPVRHGDV